MDGCAFTTDLVHLSDTARTCALPRRMQEWIESQKDVGPHQLVWIVSTKEDFSEVKLHNLTVTCSSEVRLPPWLPRTYTGFRSVLVCSSVPIEECETHAGYVSTLMQDNCSQGRMAVVYFECRAYEDEELASRSSICCSARTHIRSRLERLLRMAVVNYDAMPLQVKASVHKEGTELLALIQTVSKCRSALEAEDPEHHSTFHLPYIDEIRTRSDYTLVHLAARFRCSELKTRAIEAGADMSKRCVDGTVDDVESKFGVSRAERRKRSRGSTPIAIVQSPRAFHTIRKKPRVV